MRENVSIIVNNTKPGWTKVFVGLSDLLDRNGIDCELVGFNEHIANNKVFIIGGDGTVLNSFQNLQKEHHLIYGINIGDSVGYLCGWDLGSYLNILDDAHGSHRHVLDVEYEDNTYNNFSFNALNECVIKPKDISKPCNFSVLINGHNLGNYSCDGLIVSTSTGSTGYNLSAGGPILSSTSECFSITPISPGINSFNRPFVIDDESFIMVEFDRECILFHDGNESINLDKNTHISIRKSIKKSVTIMYPDEFLIKAEKLRYNQCD